MILSQLKLSATQFRSFFSGKKTVMTIREYKSELLILNKILKRLRKRWSVQRLEVPILSIKYYVGVLEYADEQMATLSIKYMKYILGWGVEKSICRWTKGHK